jgi:hypothetical protein
MGSASSLAVKSGKDARRVSILLLRALREVCHVCARGRGGLQRVSGERRKRESKRELQRLTIVPPRMQVSLNCSLKILSICRRAT